MPFEANDHALLHRYLEIEILSLIKMKQYYTFDRTTTFQNFGADR